MKFDLGMGPTIVLILSVIIIGVVTEGQMNNNRRAIELECNND
jgi:hypothetical protein